jgi:predicted component of type VI protein secretion system
MSMISKLFVFNLGFSLIFGAHIAKAETPTDTVLIEICESSKNFSHKILKANIQAAVPRKDSFSICKLLQQITILKKNSHNEKQDIINGKFIFKLKEDRAVYFCTYKLLPEQILIQELVVIIDQVLSEQLTVTNLYNKLRGLESAFNDVLPMDCSNDFNS